MNERIRELAEQQAGAILMDLVMPDSGMPERVKWNVGITSEHLEKFAELIVQECVRYFNEDYVRDFDVLWREDLSKGMKEHFGVEE
jgi:hypothetical protein